jgi:glycosyltransferase involved in cell wall biosynthesis
MKRICHISTLHPSTDTRIFQKECLTLADAGYDVTFIVANQEEQDLQGVKIRSVKVDYSNRIDRMRKSSRAALKKALEVNAELYHFHDPELLPLGLRLKKKGKKVIYDSHENVPEQIKTKPYLRPPVNQLVASAYRAYEHRAVKRLDGVIVANPTTLQRFKKLNNNSIAICNFPRFYEDLYVPWEKKKDELAYVGSFTENRGILQMVQSLGSLDVKLNLGGIWHSPTFKKQVMRQKGWQKVEDWGYLDRPGVIDLLGRSRIGLSLLHPIPSYKMNYSVKVFEYMAAGIPIITSNFPIFRNVVEKEDCGLCVNPLDVDAIIQAINFLLKRPGEAKAMGERGRLAAQKKYNWETEAGKLLSFYEQILD